MEMASIVAESVCATPAGKVWNAACRTRSAKTRRAVRTAGALTERVCALPDSEAIIVSMVSMRLCRKLRARDAVYAFLKSCSDSAELSMGCVCPRVGWVWFIGVPII